MQLSVGQGAHNPEQMIRPQAVPGSLPEGELAVLLDTLLDAHPGCSGTMQQVRGCLNVVEHMGRDLSLVADQTLRALLRPMRYRILSTRYRTRRRRDPFTLQHASSFTSTPNELWSWDITNLLGPAKWTHFYLYVIFDVFSRYVVGWTLQHRESAQIAQQLIGEAACQ